MGRICAVANCGRIRTCSSSHRLPLHDPERLKLWLSFLGLDVDTPVDALRRADHRVCQLHFAEEDFSKGRTVNPKKLRLKNTAVPGPFAYFGNVTTRDAGVKKLQDSPSPSPPPRVQLMLTSPKTEEDETQPSTSEMYHALPPTWYYETLPDTQTETDRSAGQVADTDTEVKAPETITTVTKKPVLQYIVDEEAILELMKSCPMCNRQCRCSKRISGPYLIVYQNCYFCSYQRKWGSQPEAISANTQKAPSQTKKKPQPKNKVPVKAKAQTSQLHQTSKTGGRVHKKLRHPMFVYD